MAHNKQSTKRIRTNEQARQANRTDRTAMKSAMKKVTGAPSADVAKAGLAEAMKKVDKAAKKRIIHKNAAARLKSQLSRALAKAK